MGRAGTDGVFRLRPRGGCTHLSRAITGEKLSRQMSGTQRQKRRSSRRNCYTSATRKFSGCNLLKTKVVMWCGEFASCVGPFQPASAGLPHGFGPCLKAHRGKPLEKGLDRKAIGQ
jgi:hypothetical protein